MQIAGGKCVFRLAFELSNEKQNPRLLCWKWPQALLSSLLYTLLFILYLPPLGHLLSSLSSSAVQRWISASVTSRFNHCNSFICDTIFEYLINFRMLHPELCYCDHIISMVKNLHWLPVHNRLWCHLPVHYPWRRIRLLTANSLIRDPTILHVLNKCIKTHLSFNVALFSSFEFTGVLKTCCEMHFWL